MAPRRASLPSPPPPPSSPAPSPSPWRGAWAAYRARGALNLAAAWALAAGFFLALVPLLLDAGRWDALVARFPSRLYAFVGIMWLANAAPTLLGNLAFAALYAGGFAWAERHRIGAAPWPWRAREPEKRAAFWRLLRRSLGLVALNLAFLPVMLSVPYLLHADHLRAFSLAGAELPSLPSLLLQLAVCFALEDAVFYLVHRALHDSRVYAVCHKIHHEWATPIVLASEHAHVLEFVVSNGLPMLAGPLLLRAHTLTYAVFVFVRVATSVDNHCGYAFPWSPVRLLPFGSTAESHDFHHARGIDAVFTSQFAVLDVLLGTLGGFPEWRRRRTAAATLAAGGRSGEGDAAR
jgi:sterol desaturase/sphingolipid hydroxylase (fatty acid hydroxylase superfamily)